MDFYTKHFSELSGSELYSILRLRAAVFVVEQNCAYLDPDHKDEDAYHVLLKDTGLLIGYSRLLAPGVSHSEQSIGRVVIKKEARLKGSGRALMRYSIDQCRELFKKETIVISAQTYLTEFYSSLGFRVEGAQYNEDGIPHVQMRLG